MKIALVTLSTLSFFAPVFLWWIRNISRIMFKREAPLITDNLWKLFMGFWGLAVVILAILFLWIR